MNLTVGTPVSAPARLRPRLFWRAESSFGAPTDEYAAQARQLLRHGIQTMKKRPELSLTQKAMQALADAVAKVVEDHRLQARPLAVWRDGKAIWASATEPGALQESPTPYRTRQTERLKKRC